MSRDTKRVLIVEDEPDVSSFLKMLLEDNGYVCDVAANGREGEMKLREFAPHLLTLDISMPEESGLRLYKVMREAGNHTPVIVVTGVTPEVRRFLDSRRHLDPPDAFFEKPIDKQEFLDTVKRLVE